MKIRVQDLVVDARIQPVSAELTLLLVGGCYLAPADVTEMGLHLEAATEPERTALDRAGFVFGPLDQKPASIER